MRGKISDLRSQKYVGAIELADEAARLLDQFVPRQERGSVTEVPDERMVRYYSSEGLIASPEGKQGSAAVYGYAHLLQLLAVKKLQADHLSIKNIRELVEGKSERDLEQILNMGAGGRTERPRNSATEYLESLIKPAKSQVPSAPSPTIVQSAPLRRTSSGEIRDPAAAAANNAWARLEIGPGLEIHVRDDYRPPDDSRERQRLGRRLLNAIENFGRTPRK
jgi:DNA-binding transcriptional MerR regulator